MLMNLAPVTRVLVFACIAVFGLQMLYPGLNRWFALWPLMQSPGGSFMPWQLFSYSFLHGSFPHLALNMIGLASLGSDVERLIGRREYLRLWFLSVGTAAITQQLVTLMTGPASTVGASGGVFGMMLAFARFFPDRQLMLIIPPIPVKARVFVVVYAIIELWLGVTGPQSGVAHFAHLGGLLGGWWAVHDLQKRGQ